MNPRESLPLSFRPIARTLVIMMTLLSGAAFAQAPPVQSGYGINVHNAQWLNSDQQTLVVTLSTPSVLDNAVHGQHQVRITFPDGYQQNNDLHYPVLYLLHGGAGGSSRQWTDEGMAAITEPYPLITVTPDGGKVGWYRNWVNQSQGAQNWEDFHLYQLIPWIDMNFRTLNMKAGRAIAGLSMGGFGAIHYAQQRPDLFAYAASFSGALNIESSPTQLVIAQQAQENGFPSDGPFGPTSGGTWVQYNPLHNSNGLHNVEISLYTGMGTWDFDVLEREVMAATDAMHHSLNHAGINHFYQKYPWRAWHTGPYGCDGGHNFNCWRYTLSDVLPRMMTVLAQPDSDGHDPLTPSGAIGERYHAMGGSNSPLGEPTQPEMDAQQGGRYQRFENGIILWHPDTGAHPIYGQILAHFEATGVEGHWGFPVMTEADAGPSPQSGSPGRYQYFKHAHGDRLLLWTASTGAHGLHGAIHHHFADNGREAVFGYPTSDEQPHNGGVRQSFEMATLFWTPQQGIVVQFH